MIVVMFCVSTRYKKYDVFKVGYEKKILLSAKSCLQPYNPKMGYYDFVEVCGSCVCFWQY